VIIVSNIADLIEAYILRQLAAQQDGKVELRRTDIADEISCAPSQISYVLSTRFTQDKGFVVESRRGLGGYIRIVQVPTRNMVYQDMLDKIDKDTEMPMVQSMVHYLLQHQMISNREAALMMQVVVFAYQSERVTAEERVHLLKSMILTLENFS
jgi:transcriptional regulator CtsR